MTKRHSIRYARSRSRSRVETHCRHVLKSGRTLERIEGGKEKAMASIIELQNFLEEIATLRALAQEAGIARQLLAVIDDLKNQVENTGTVYWQDKEWRALKRETLADLSLNVLRAFGSCDNVRSISNPMAMTA